ncbi:monocarboxylate transporter 12-like [Haliotis rufescens]|uniref:monocarboxylate transporter 12-like n=1 Tax=Haliotis rufescens TaxID=6454 RepID=UPI00201ECE95|nr:monocarboxylate transporter 12-like [Haliotis rufescens]
MKLEGMYSWVVLAASFTTMMLGPSVNYAIGVFHVAMLKEFEEDLVLTTWIGSIFGCMFALAGPVASLVINVFGCRTCVVVSGILMMIGFASSSLVTDIRMLFMTYAVVAGLGTGLAGTGAIVVLGYYFPENAAVAQGICVAGAGLGMFVHPVLVQYLLDTYGFHGAFLITGGIVFHASATGMLMRPSEIERKKKRQFSGGGTLRSKIILLMCGDCAGIVNVVKNISFLLFAVSIFCFALGASTEYLFLPDFFMKEGSTFKDASFVISLSGTGSVISRILTGIASNDEDIGSAILHTSTAGIMAIFTLFVPLFQSSSQLKNLYGFFLGLYTGGVWVLMNTITLDILGLQNFATGVGVVMFFCGTGYLIGPPIAGAILEASGDYYNVFLFSGAMMFSASAFGFLSTPKKNTLSPLDDTLTELKVYSDNAFTGVAEVRENLVSPSEQKELLNDKNI